MASETLPLHQRQIVFLLTIGVLLVRGGGLLCNERRAHRPTHPSRLAYRVDYKVVAVTVNAVGKWCGEGLVYLIAQECA